MNLMKNKIILSFIFILSVLGVLAQEIPEPMYPYRLVNDFAQIFSPEEQEALEQKLLAYNDSTSTQIYVVTISDLQGYDASDFAFRLGDKWGIGQKSKDNGAVILVKPKTADSNGQAFIATGYGLEARINDAYAGRIIRNKMIPHFKEDDYFSGVNAAVDEMIARLSGEFSADEEESDNMPIWVIILLILIIIVVISVSSGGDQHIGGNRNRRSGGTIFFPTSGGNSGWGGGFGGFGGGFGGGGGGSFGGGGAGGRW